LIHEGNVRRIIIKDSDGATVLDMPVTVGVIGLLVAPTLTAVGTLGALAADYSIDVEREHAEGAEPAVTLISPSREDKSKENTMERYRSLLEGYVELYNAGDLDGVMDLYAEDSTQLMPDGFFDGRSAIRDRLSQELTAFSEIAHRYVSYVEGGDAFADEFVFVGTHTGAVVLPDGTELPPTGRRVEVQGMELVKVRDGKIVVDNLYYDNFAVAAQLGLVPQAVPMTTA
jgi:predicted ester cyclase